MRSTKASRTLPCVLLLASVLTGCGGLARTDIVPHPDAPMLITEATGRLRVSVYDAAQNRMVELGWVDAAQLKGRTVSKYDWESLIIRRSSP